MNEQTRSDRATVSCLLRGDALNEILECTIGKRSLARANLSKAIRAPYSDGVARVATPRPVVRRYRACDRAGLRRSGSADEHRTTAKYHHCGEYRKFKEWSSHNVMLFKRDEIPAVQAEISVTTNQSKGPEQ